jgi:serine/threonine protein kinase
MASSENAIYIITELMSFSLHEFLHAPTKVKTAYKAELIDKRHSNAINKPRTTVNADQQRRKSLKVEKTPEISNPLMKCLRKMSHILNILFDVCKGINYMHNKQLIHRDLKPANILLNFRLTAKLVILLL